MALMAEPRPKRPVAHRLRELVVPAMMAAVAVSYAYDAMALSVEALILPTVLGAVMAGSLLWAVGSAFLGAGRSPIASAIGEVDGAGSISDAKPWLLVAAAILAAALLDYIGAMAALVLLVTAAQLTLALKAPLKALLIAALVTIPTYALFKYVLYVRFPAGVLGLG
jgi:hypothetical protein